MAKSGEILNSRYRVLRELGRGGTAVVFLVEDLHSGERWAAKEYKKEKEKNSITQEDVRSQSEILRALKHPSIPRLKDCFENSFAWYIIVEYLPGESLDNVVAKNGPLPQNKVVDIGIQLCEVLAYLHNRPRPIVYRDLKPSNIMFCGEREPQVSLFDFSIAVKSNGHGHSIKAQGTKGFAAPEQFKTDGINDIRADIYGFGATLYNLLTGARPSDGNIYPITCWNSSLSANLERLILKCTETDPDKRYGSCAEIKDELSLYIQNEIDLPDKKAASRSSAERCSSCRYSPASCAPGKRRNMSQIGVEARSDDGSDTTQDLDATEIFGFAERNDIDTILLEAKRAIHFQPRLKILECNSDEIIDDSTMSF